jgi:hypothetical protein
MQSLNSFSPTLSQPFDELTCQAFQALFGFSKAFA